MKYDVRFQGEAGRKYGLRIPARPSIPSPEEIVEEYEIPGRGTLATRTGTYRDIEIEVEFGFFVPPDLWMKKFRECKRWLLRHGDGKLQFTDDPGVYWHVKQVQIDEAERELKKIGRFTATFICDPYQYLEEGDRKQPLPAAFYNPYEVARPIYTVSGNGNFTITVNGKSMEAYVTEQLVIDTERMLAYRNPGTMQNTAVQGEYEDLFLQQGENVLEASSGFTVQIQPRWRML